MRDRLNVYPGKAFQYPRSLLLVEDERLLAGPVIYSRPPPWHPHATFRPASLEDVTSPAVVVKDKRKPKLSLRLVRNISRLVSGPVKEEEEDSHVVVEYDPIDVHAPIRSGSLDGAGRRTLSRKQILASLEEQEEESMVAVVEDWGRREWMMMEEASSSSSREDSSEESEEPPFSRCSLLQSISREEIRELESSDDERKSSGEEILSNNNNNNSHPHPLDNSHEVDNNRNVDLHCDNCGSSEVSELRLDELCWVGTLGVGGFGRVELVTANNRAFALKKMKKIEIKDEKHQQHIINEKNIMSDCSSPFIVQLYRTFKDNRYLYMLMEPCLGGELWTILRNQKKFDDESSRFYTACVIKAFEYLHDKGIVYRDLKPENLLLDATGYIKLTDFGFSKKLEPGEKSWTFCGTPEYVAPEIITNKSHDHRADIWSVGILMYELLNGIPPFSKKSSTSSQVYSDILKGMKTVNFPSYMSATAVELIRQLCRLSPVQRPSLAITKKYMWFAGMDWRGLENRTLTPPHLPQVRGVKDISNFDNYVRESEEPDLDFSDWDREF